MAGGLGGTNFGVTGSGFGSAGSAISSFGAAAGDLITATGDEQAAGLFGQAATIAGQSATEAAAVGKLQQVQTARQVMMTQGQNTAAAAAGGLRIGGSASAIIRSNAAQGALANSLIAENTGINVNSYLQQQTADKEQQAQATAAAQAAQKASGFAEIGGVLSGLGAITDFAGAVAA